MEDIDNQVNNEGITQVSTEVSPTSNEADVDVPQISSGDVNSDVSSENLAKDDLQKSGDIAQKEQKSHGDSLLGEYLNKDDRPKEDAKSDAPEVKDTDLVEGSEPKSFIDESFSHNDLNFEEGFNVDEEKFNQFKELAIEDRIPKEKAQKYVDIFNNSLKEYARSYEDHIWNTWKDTQKQWRNEVMSDQELGGAGHETVLKRVSALRDKYVPQEHRENFMNFLNVTGAGNHPEFIRFLNNIAKDRDSSNFVREPEYPSGQMGVPVSIDPRKQTRAGRLYDRSK